MVVRCSGITERISYAHTSRYMYIQVSLRHWAENTIAKEVLSSFSTDFDVSFDHDVRYEGYNVSKL